MPSDSMNATLSGRDILVVEDEALLRKRLVRYLEKEGASCAACESLAEGRRALESMSFDYALVDIHLPDGRGLDLVGLAPGVSTIVMTADGGWQLAVEAMKRGAADYLGKPFELEELPLVFARCAKAKAQQRARRHRQQGAGVDEGGPEVVFGPGLAETKRLLERALEADRRLASSPPPVLLEGETGAGKSTFAKWLHARGPRADQELVAVNCAALPEALAESELFGHEKGAFTDAKTARIGLFEAADGGTLFLDEIGSLPLPLQAKVLTAIEERQIRRVGSSRSLTIDVKLVAASNRDLDALVEEGGFRADLYHRINLLRVRIPPLRERREDILPLAERLLAGLARRYGLPELALSEEGRRQLRAYHWPGNTRELAHELEKAVILGEPTALAFPGLAAGEGGGAPAPAAAGPDGDWLAPGWRFPESGFSIEETIDRLVGLALEQAQGNVSAAARLLGVPRDYVRYRLKRRQ